MRKLPLSLLAVGVFAAAYAAGACACAVAARRRLEPLGAGASGGWDAQSHDPHPGDDTDEALAHHELANWARQAMFASR